MQEKGYALDLEYTLSGNVDAAAFDPAGKEFFMDQNEQRTYTISEVVEQTGLTADTLRFYEKIDLLGSPERGAAANGCTPAWISAKSGLSRTLNEPICR
ncbi:hypothetical protein HMSSN139_13640 [Paenibacillus sp. HMSSN-139]|nr:hypothetical protein HMSSN139_13640 [Paenibacillus sp. HMSSN-139]